MKSTDSPQKLGGWTLRRQFSFAIATVCAIVALSLYGVRLLGQAALFHYEERNHMQRVLSLKSDLSAVENGTKDSKQVTIESIIQSLNEIRRIPMRIDEETYWFERSAMRLAGRSALIDLPYKDIADIDQMLKVVAEYPIHTGALPTELAAQLDPDMSVLLENSSKFAPLTLDATTFIKTTVRALSILGSIVLIGIIIILRGKIIHPLSKAVETAQRVASGDLTEKITRFSNDETGDLMTSLANMNSSLVRLVRNARREPVPFDWTEFPRR